MRSIPASVDVVGVGLNATDTIIRLPHFPARDTKMEFESAQVYPGGQVASAIVACSRWGLSTRYIGKVGDDFAGALQRDEMAGTNVEVHWISVRKCSSQVAYILVDSGTGERTILWHRDSRLAISPDELRREWIISARALHVDGHDTAAAATVARWARAAGIPVTADVDNLYPRLEALLENTDYLISSREFPVKFMGGSDLPKTLKALSSRFGCRLAGATLGREGVLAWDALQARYVYSPAFQVPTVDTTGAGDIFHGGFLYSMRQGWPLEQILEFSCAAAALNCAAFGARGGIASLAEIVRLMREGKRHSTAFDTQALNRS